ncbi:MAG TPA: rhodanese-like domain-containing protein [Candidatus Acidoferrales bacterium]|nr:rhodanese-like domain-containing protein [Candidatus Acidoferrales bacterium]
MIFEQYYLECLSQASYLIADETTGRGIVVDPRRDIEQYLESAKEHDATIELVVETHFHADFLSGHLELAKATGAEIAFGSHANPEFVARALHDGERISLGQVTLEIRETPGHTPESISIVVYEHPDDMVPYGVLTGDTLFIGDVGRPDLLSSVGVTSYDLANMLYDSLNHKLMTLPDVTRVFPGHGAGSACGKNLSTDLSSTIGEQRASNYALQPMSRDEFVSVVTEGQPTVPAYFGYDALRNRESHALLEEHEHPQPLTIAGALEYERGGAVLLDTRDVNAFATGGLVGSVNVGLEGRYAQYVGSVVYPDEQIVLLAEPGTELEAKVRLGRIGYDRVVGYVENLYAAFQENPELVQVASRLTAGALDERRRTIPGLQVVDVRNAGEVEEGSIPGAANIPLPVLRDGMTTLDPSRPTVVFCAGGYRSSIAASLLRHAGFKDVSDVLGGYRALHAAQTGKAVSR